jgi:hypothetical protein
MPDSFVIVEQDQFHNETDQCKSGAVTNVAEHPVSDTEAYQIAETLPGDSLGE